MPGKTDIGRHQQDSFSGIEDLTSETGGQISGDGGGPEPLEPPGDGGGPEALTEIYWDGGLPETLTDGGAEDQTSPADLTAVETDTGMELATESDVCAPNCGAKVCGDDGCGGSCGQCNEDANPCTDAVCQDGVCVHVDNGQPCFEPLPAIMKNVNAVVVGAGSGGVMAAIQAARLGLSVALVEETDWVGGQMTSAAVASMDDGSTNRDSGIYKEFMDKIKAHYGALGKSIGTCYWSNSTYCFEPKVGRAVLLEMLGQEPGVELYLRARLTGVQYTGGATKKITGITAEQPAGDQVQPYEFKATIVIDATEHGDVLALSPASYRAGNSTSDSLIPVACVQDNTYTVVIRKYPGAVPPGFLLSAAPPGYDNTVKAHFASIVATNGWHWLSGPNNYPVDWLTHVGYRGMPDSATPGSYSSTSPELISRTGINWANDFPYTVADLDPAVRKQKNCEAKLRTLQFIYYLQAELGQTQWSVANDEGYDTAFNTQDNLCDNIPAQFKELEKHFPVMPYVRESRRLIGVKTVTAGEIRRSVHCPGCPARAETNFPSALAIGDYPVDLHACNTNSTLELGLESEADVPSGFKGGAFQVPFEALVPESVDGLLAAEKNLSVTRLVNGAIRLQPITMLTGQAAGVIAALSIQQGLQPRHLSPIKVQDYLVRQQGCRISLQDFADIPRSHPRWEDVQMVAAHDIMNGYSDIEFGASDDLLRGWAAVVITRLFGINTGNPPANPTFNDVPKNHPAYEFIEGLVAAGFTSGCSINPPLFCPDDPLSRAAIAKFLVSGLGWNLDSAPKTPYFQDMQPGHWAFESVQLLKKNGLMDGCSGNSFCPDDPVERTDMARTAAAVLVLLAE